MTYSSNSVQLGYERINQHEALRSKGQYFSNHEKSAMFEQMQLSKDYPEAERKPIDYVHNGIARNIHRRAVSVHCTDDKHLTDKEKRVEYLYSWATVSFWLNSQGSSYD